MTHELEGPLDLDELWAVLDGRAAPGFEYPAWQTKTMKIALDIGPTDIKIRSSRFSMQWEGRGRSTYFPKLAPAVTADLMKRAGVARVETDAVAWMPSATVPGDADLRAFEPPPYVVWFVRREDGLDVFTRQAGEADPPLEPGRVAPDGPHTLPIPWSSPVWKTYRDFPGGLTCSHCDASAERYRVITGAALICGACGRSFDP